MARISRKNVELFLILQQLMMNNMFIAILTVLFLLRPRNSSSRRLRENLVRYVMAHRMPIQVSHLWRITTLSDTDCLINLRMTRHCFSRLCYLLEHCGGLVDSKHVRLEEQVCIFLSILAHHKKNMIVKHDFVRSGQTVSKHFNVVLCALLKIYSLFLVKPTPVLEGSSNARWKHFKGCLGALDGTYIKVTVRTADQPRYRTRKGEPSVNVLGVVNRDLNFIYFLPGWEGSAADARVLRDAVTRPNGLKVPIGNYYLCDNGYTNCEGFLTPFKGVRYHLKEWDDGCQAPQNYKEYFNMKHSKARNVIERAWAVLKKRWAILRSPSFYPIKTQNRIIMACCLLHNFIRSEMPVDPMEELVPESVVNNSEEVGDTNDFVDVVETSSVWTQMRENMAMSMYNEWRASARRCRA